MKNIICVAIGCFAISFFAHAELEKYDWTATLRVIDDEGHPVQGAEVQASYGQTNVIGGISDANGMFIASHHDAVENLVFVAEKGGYYPFRMLYHKGYKYNVERSHPSQTIVLKRIIRPIPMYAKCVNLGLPIFDRPAGFDLTAADWVSPYGKGANSDLVFTGHREMRAANDSDYSLTVSFSNQGDGIQEFKAPLYYLGSRGSALQSAQEAPTNGYQSEWKQTIIRRPGISLESNRDMNRHFYIRVRTVLDLQGNVKSALYGKIYGDFMQFTYYVDPTPNSRNVEFDPKENLFKNLSFLEKVKDP